MMIIRITVIVAAFFICAAALSQRKKVHIFDAVGVTTAGLVILLYFLAFFRLLNFIDWIAAGIIACLCGWGIYVAAVKKDCGQAKMVIKDGMERLLTPELITFLAMAVVLTFLVKDEIFSWWDDINFWSSDAKALYYLGGFPGKYGNVSPEFGDYPPATSLFKWLFLHFSNTYQQGLQFAGFYILNALFLLPLAKPAAKANKFLRVLFVLSLFMIPTVVSGFLNYGTPADVTMGILYGTLLLSIWDREEVDARFYFVRIAAYTSVLLLTKSTGIEWALFALAFYFLINGFSKKKLPGIAFAVLAASVVYGSWLGFCFLNRRVAKLTGAGLRIAASAASGGVSMPDNTMLKAQSFLTGFVSIPMHTDLNVTLDLSALALLLIFFAVIGIYRVYRVIEGRVFWKLLIYFALTGFAAYGIIFLCHLTIFATEEQYLEASQMALSIARYGAPFEIGGIYLLMGILLDRYKATKRITAAVAICLVFTLLTANYSGIYEALIGYHAKTEERVETFNSTIDDEGKKFVELVEGDESLYGHRILFVRDAGMNHQIKDAYISNEISPIPVVYCDFYSEGEWADTRESISQKIRESHAEYLYVQQMPEDSAIFDGFTGNGEFKENCLYKIETDENGEIHLLLVKD